MRILAFILVISCIGLFSCHIFNPYMEVHRKIEKQDFDAALYSLSRIKKDTSISSLEAFVYTKHYKTSSPFQNLDSAIFWAHIGDSIFEKSPYWENNFVIKKTKDTLPFSYLISEIDSLGFQKAMAEASEKSYIHYLSNYPNSRYTESAINNRDSIAFQNAKFENTYLAYKNFLEKYPQSLQAEQAKEIYELLLFETHTRDQTLGSLENFIYKFPHSPYLKEAEHKVFELYTLDGRKSSFEKFINQYPNSFKADEAKLWIDYQSTASDSIEPYFFLPNKDAEGYVLFNPLKPLIDFHIDSIKGHNSCKALRKEYLIYSIQNKWGLADNMGRGLIPPVFQDLDSLKPDIYIYKNQSKFGLAHISGFIITEAIFDDFNILNDTFISVTQGGRKKIMTNNGKILTDSSFQDIKYLGNEYMGFKHQDRWAIVKSFEFFDWPIQPSFNFEFDSIHSLSHGNLFAIKGNEVILLDSTLKTIVGFVLDSALINNQGYLIYSKDKKALINHSGNFMVEWTNQKIFSNANGYASYQDTIWNCSFFDTTFTADSFECFQPYYCSIYNASNTYLLSNNGMIDVSDYDRFSLQFFSDTFAFTIVKNDKVGLVSNKDKLILKTEYEDIKVFDINSIRIKKNGKYGLVTLKGETILKSEYDAITNYSNGAFTLLNKSKFGFVYFDKSIFIKPVLNSSLKFINTHSPLFSRQLSNGKMELINGKKESVAIAEEFQLVNDSLVFFKQNYKWDLMKLNTKGLFESQDLSCMSYSIWEDRNGINHILFTSETGDGFYNVILQEKIYPEYYKLYPIAGSQGGPLYFLSFKYYEEINLYLLKILNKNGEEIFKSLINEDQMERMTCEDL